MDDLNEDEVMQFTRALERNRQNQDERKSGRNMPTLEPNIALALQNIGLRRGRTSPSLRLGPSCAASIRRLSKNSRGFGGHSVVSA
jgi:hypothetical protein